MLRYILTIALGVVAGQYLYAQPSNNTCASATSINTHSTCTNSTYSITGATSTITQCDGSGSEVWYSFVATDASMTVEADGAGSTDIVLEVFSGSCGSFTNIACEDVYSSSAEVASLTGLTVGATYYVAVYTYASGGTFSFDLCAVGASATGSGGGSGSGSGSGTGVSCADAESISIGSTDCATISAAGAMTGSHPCTGVSSSYDDGGHWYSFVGDGSTVSVDFSGFAASSVYWLGFEVYSGSCGSLSCEDAATALTGETSESLSVNTVNGNTYYIFMSSWGANPSACVTLTSGGSSGTGGAGNNCANAETLTIGVSDCDNVVDNSGSFGNSSSTDNPCSNYYNDYEYWYSVTGTGDALNVTISNMNSTYLSVSVLDDCPGSSPSCVASYQNGSSSSNFSVTTPVLNNGDTYYIVISSWGSVSSGDEGFCINTSSVVPTTPGGTTCGNIQPICTDVGLTFTANASGVSDVRTSEPGNNYGCLSTSPNPSWYYLEIGVDGDIDMDLSAASDIDFALWGPFANVTAAQAACGSLPAPADCSWSASNTEDVNITGGQVGEVYILLITNYASVVQDVTLTQSGGLGATNCGVVCGVDVGTTAVTMGTTVSNNYILCYDDSLNMTTTGASLPTASDVAGVGYALYTAAPVTGDPSTDPNFTGYYYTSADHDEKNDADNTYDFIIANPSSDAGSNGVPSNRALIFVPITMDDIAKTASGGSDDNLGHDLNGDGCFDLGNPITVVYLDSIKGTTVETCGVNVVITLSGGYPGFDAASSYTVSNTGAGTMVQSGSQGQVLTFTELNTGEVITVDVTNDNNGCTETITFTTTCPTSSCNADAGSW